MRSRLFPPPPLTAPMPSSVRPPDAPFIVIAVAACAGEATPISAPAATRVAATSAARLRGRDLNLPPPFDSVRPALADMSLALLHVRPARGREARVNSRTEQKLMIFYHQTSYVRRQRSGGQRRRHGRWPATA